MITKKNDMQLVFASANANKVREIQQLFPETIQVLSLNDIKCTEDIPETSSTIEGNAIQKANYISDRYGYFCFADDTGLEVSVLGGAPGVFSARYAGEHKSTDDNINKLLYELLGVSDRSAQFKTVICLNLKGQQYLFEGIIKGKIIEARRGFAGFGYDPVFVPDGYDITFAEMTLEEKAIISHRGIAIKKMIDFLKSF